MYRDIMIALYFLFTEANPDKGTKTKLRRCGVWVAIKQFTEANPDKGTKTIPWLDTYSSVFHLFTEANPDKGTKTSLTH